MSLMRLDKLIAASVPELSRNDVKLLCRRGYVQVNGSTVKSSEEKIDPERDAVTLRGEPVSYKRKLYIMLNKPAGVVCATRDGLTQTVLELLPAHLRRQGLFPAGRLDKDTEGFVLVTDDGELAHRMLSPKSHVPKKYFVLLDKPLTGGEKNAFARGLEIDGGDKCLPAELTELDTPGECMVVLQEGMYHQVKRMFETVGNHVKYLKRVEIGELCLDPVLKPGECRELEPEEILRLTSHRKQAF